MVFQRPRRKSWYIQVQLPSGRVRWSTGTTDRSTAKAMERAVDDLVAAREWDLLDAVQAKRINIGQLFDAHRRRRLDDLRRQMDVVDLSPLVDEFIKVHSVHVRPDTARYYRFALRRLMPLSEQIASLGQAASDPKGTPKRRQLARAELDRARVTREIFFSGEVFPASGFSVTHLESWLATYPGGNESRRKVHAALSVFAAYLVRQERLPHNPLLQIKAPAPNAPRCRYLETEQMIALADAQREPYQSFSAFLHGSGADVSTALMLRAADVDLERKEVRAAGTKSHARNRIVRVADWAWPYVVARVAPLSAGEKLFVTDRWRARDSHYAACAALGIEDYWLRDARHSFAVRAARAGWPAKLIADQLGHVDATMVLKVYGKFMADSSDRDRWEKRATEFDVERARALAARARDVAERSVPNGVPARDDAPAGESTKSPNPMGLDDFESSRGGTRTRDPGIMSAVL